MKRPLDRLKGGDLRSIGAANDVARDAERDPALVRGLVDGLLALDPVVRMRCADALEKATRTNPDALSPHRTLVLELLSSDPPKEVLWHLLQLAPRIRWGRSRLPRVFEAVEACLVNPSSIVKTSALQALVELTDQAPADAKRIHRLVVGATTHGTPAMRARARKLLGRKPRG